MNVQMKCEWYRIPGFEGFGRGEGEKCLKIALK